nr:BTAD domain-containing putative transcriptional regulator [Deinococcus sp. JMULE3]
MVTAPAGYGKTTALAEAAAARPGPVAWLTLDSDDADPLVLAASLSLAVQGLPGGARPGEALGAGASPRRVAGLVADVLDGCAALLVLDEAQGLSGTPGADLLGELLAPGEGRVALLSRTALDLPELARLEVSGDAARLSAAELAFTPAEIAALFASQGLTLSGAEVRAAHAATEGWPIAVRFLTQAAAQGRVTPADLADLEGGDAPLGTLFTYLAQEVLGPLDPSLRGLLTRSSVFEELIPALLEDALDEPRARTLLDALAGSGTFLTRAGEDTYRAHPLLRAHLRGLLPPEEARAVAARGAAFFERTGRLRRALAAHLLAGNAARAATLLAGRGGVWLAQGRVTLVDRSLSRLPRAVWTPALHALAGDALRLASRYDEARAEYALAGPLDRALGEVRLALDTVQPAHAWGPLDEAAALIGGDRQGEVRRLRAENLLNAGQLAEAVALEPELRGGARYALRSGDLDAALSRALALADGETGGARAAQNHREGLLLASFLHAARGEVHAAGACARRGLAEGERLESPFVQALALARLGHAQQAAGDFAAARESYEAALRQAQHVAGRLQVEPLMGLAALAGRAGDGARAQALTAEARGQTGGDRYMEGLLVLTAALGLAQGPLAPQAPDGLRQATALFSACGDAFGQAAAALALFTLDAGGAGAAAQAVTAYPFLLGRPSLFAPVASRAGRAALLARLGEAHPDARGALATAARELGYAAVPDPADTPGFEVQVQVLGRVAVLREDGRVREWGRAKARDLLALLAVHPAGLPREAAQEALFPDADPGVGERNFRVTLHALGQVLEEARARSGVFLERGDWLRLRPGADLHVDLAAAWAHLGQAAGTPGRLEALLALPPTLADVDLEDVAREAERYAAALPEALAAEAEVALAVARPDRAARAAGRALSLDPAHEPAARALMRAQHALGRGAAAGRVYAALSAALADLGLRPLPETQALWQALSGARA